MQCLTRLLSIPLSDTLIVTHGGQGGQGGHSGQGGQGGHTLLPIPLYDTLIVTHLILIPLSVNLEGLI